MFSKYLLDEVEVFSASVHYVASWSVGIQNWTCFLGQNWKLSFVDSVSFSPKCTQPAQTQTNT